MKIEKVIATKLSLPAEWHLRANLLSSQRIPLSKLDIQRIEDITSKRGDIILIDDTCYTFCLSTNSWHLIPLTPEASNLYRIQYLIQTTELHHFSSAIH
jgi:hypothetical protein